MKLTKKKLKRIIKEEIEKLKEQSGYAIIVNIPGSALRDSKFEDNPRKFLRYLEEDYQVIASEMAMGEITVAFDANGMSESEAERWVEKFEEALYELYGISSFMEFVKDDIQSPSWHYRPKEDIQIG